MEKLKPFKSNHFVATERIWEMPSVDTFKMSKLREWILKWFQGRVLNVFGGKTKLDEYYLGEIIHNDLNKEIDADTHYDACFIDRYFQTESFDTIILDPPYSMYQAVHSYEGVRCQDITRVRVACDKLLRNGGIVISFGWNSVGMPSKYGYRKLAICIVSSGGSHNDIIITVDRKIKGVLRNV